ncbi:hypothetical protein MGH68_11195 [Erysipelothrix sp. D19-032]
MKHMIDNMLSAFETELENKPYTEETVVAVVQNILADYTNLINKKNLKISVSVITPLEQNYRRSIRFWIT